MRKILRIFGTRMTAAEQYVVDENGNEIAVILPSGNTGTWKKTFMISRWLPNGGTKLRSALPG